MQETISILRDVFTKQENIESFFDRLNKYLDGVFALNEDFSINAFNTVFCSLEGNDFAQALYSSIIEYDNDNFIDSLAVLENEYLIQNIKDLIFIYGPRLEKYYYKQVEIYKVRSSGAGYRKMNERYQICIEIENFANERITIYDDPNNVLILCSKLLNAVNEVNEVTKTGLDEKLKARLKKQIRNI